jgi:hypothetical protein
LLRENLPATAFAFGEEAVEVANELDKLISCMHGAIVDSR